jgi:hypothetical protein
MLDIVKNSSNGNGAISGRGLAHRKLWPGERIALAADVATKQRSFEPSLGQLADIFDVSATRLRDELKARQREADLQAKQTVEQPAAPPAKAVSVVTTNDAMLETITLPATAGVVVELRAEVQALLSKTSDIARSIYRLSKALAAIDDDRNRVTDRLFEVSDRLWEIESPDGNDVSPA